MGYAAGDTVVHPRHGVARIEGIETRGAGEGRTSFLELACAAGPLRILVPVGAVEEIGIRHLPTRREAASILGVLAQPSDVPEAWSERNALTTSRIASTELAQASMVVRDLTRHSQRSGKALSSAEQADLETCLRSVASELSIVLELSDGEARDLILEAAQSAS